MNCIICGWPTGQPKDSYGFTMPNLVPDVRRLPAKDRQARVHKTCLRNCGKNRRERYAHVVKTFTESRAAAPAVAWPHTPGASASGCRRGRA